MTPGAPLRGYFAIEARRAAAPQAWVALAAGLAFIGATHAMLPRLPGQVIALLESAFRVRGMTAVLLLNDYLAIYTALFFGGVAQLLQVVAMPREARSLEILLAKPIPRAQFVAARTLPVLASVFAQGVILALACAVAVRGPNEALAGGELSACLVLTAATVLLLSVVNCVFVRVADAAQGLLVAFITWSSTLLPASVLVYRPDLFEGRDLAASLLVAPVNLIWHAAAMPALWPLATAVAFGAGIALSWATGALLQRAELR